MEELDKIRKAEQDRLSNKISDMFDKAQPQPQGGKYGVGKKTVMVDVTRGGKTFKRRQQVGFTDESRFLGTGGKKTKQEDKEGRSTGLGGISTSQLKNIANNADTINARKIANAELKKRGEKVREIQWYDEDHMKYNLKPLPVGVDKKNVEYNTLDDIHSGWYMRWKDPKTGVDKYSYTAEHSRRKALAKFDRVSSLPDTFLTDLSEKAGKLMESKKNQQEGMVLYIMSKTGLRIGDERHLNKTGNEGLTTLSVGSVKVKGDTVTLDFIGKSTHRNVSTIQDARLAKAIKKQMAGKKQGDRLFPDASRASTIKIFKDDFGYKDWTVKDVRTFVAGTEAIQALYGSTPPPPLPENNKEARKLIANRLKSAFETVSNKLNNSPKMAESSYVNPIIIEHWMDKIGGNKIVKAGDADTGIPTISEIAKDITIIPPINPEAYIDDEPEDDDDITYNMPSWMSNLLSEE